MSTYYLLSLGCPKNEVDAESMAVLLREAGYRGTDIIEDADILIVNTCGFLEAAVAEAIDAILDMAAYKENTDGRARFLIVCGCMSQRYKAEILTSMPEVDAVLGTAQYGDIAETVKRLERGEDLRGLLPGRPGSLAHLREDRIPSNGRQSYAYLKIAEGCSNACTYCKIPSLRGGANCPTTLQEETNFHLPIFLKIFESLVKDIEGDTSILKGERCVGGSSPSAPTRRSLFKPATLPV